MARKEKPQGSEIASLARNIKLDHENESESEIKGKRVAFTPAKLDFFEKLKTRGEREQEMSKGHVVGMLDAGLEGDETGLPVGKYNIFLANVNDEWHAYAESGGEIIAEAARVNMQHFDDEESKITKPEFNEEGWCVCWCLCPVLWWCGCRVCICW